MVTPTSRHLSRACYYMIALAATAMIILPVNESGGFSIAVAPVVETPSMDSLGDVADDPAIWVHPRDASLSVLLGTSKDKSQGGLYAYTLDGYVLGKYASGRALNNTDLRYDFPLGNKTIDIVGATNRTDSTFIFFGMDPVSRNLIHVGSVAVTLRDPYGFCMYKSSVDGSSLNAIPVSREYPAMRVFSMTRELESHAIPPQTVRLVGLASKLTRPAQSTGQFESFMWRKSSLVELRHFFEEISRVAYLSSVSRAAGRLG